MGVHNAGGAAAPSLNRVEIMQPNRPGGVVPPTHSPQGASMLKHLTLSTAALLAGLGLACAQQAPNTAAQNNEQAKPAQNGAEEPGSHPAKTADVNAFVNGKLNVPGAPEDSQTVPSTVSARNARSTRCRSWRRRSRSPTRRSTASSRAWRNRTRR